MESGGDGDGGVWVVGEKTKALEVLAGTAGESTSRELLRVMRAEKSG